MSTPDVFLVMRYGHHDRIVSGTFAQLARDLGVRLRPVLPWTEWVSVDGDVSILRLPATNPLTTSSTEHEVCHV